MNKVDSFQNRFNYVLNLRGLRQVDITNGTDISKALIHKYIIGDSDLFPILLYIYYSVIMPYFTTLVLF